MAFEIEDKTEQPTERRRRLAREQGHGPRSADLTLACRLLGLALALQWFGGRLVQDCSQLLVDSFQRAPLSELTVDVATSRGWEALLQIGTSAMGCVMCVLVAGIVAQWFQVGFRFRVAEVLPDANRLSPLTGFGKFWRIENASQAIYGLFKFLVFLGVGVWCVWSNLGRLSNLSEGHLGMIATEIGTILVTLAWQLAALALLIGLADYGYQVWKFEQSLKMSPAEVREEHREQSGDPRWKQQRRELWRQQLRIDGREAPQ